MVTDWSPKSAAISRGSSGTTYWFSGASGHRGLLTVKEVAALLKVSTTAVYSWCEKDELRHVRLFDNAIRIEPADLRAFVEGRRGRESCD